MLILDLLGRPFNAAVVFTSGYDFLFKSTPGHRRKILIVFLISSGGTGSLNRNGTCFTANECESKGGTSSGSCAAGYYTY